MTHTEDSRVKIPSILHLTRLGYEYLSLQGVDRNEDTNIFTNIFIDSIVKINHGIEEDEARALLNDVTLLLENEDLGKAFYERITQRTGLKVIDFENFDNNTFNVVTELSCKNGDESFRPDISLLINGMPLAFIEVKKPNNKDGIIAERNRMETRFQNKKFRRFANITQLMVFSNNMEYDDDDINPIEGVFYASPSYQKHVFNYFREEEKLDLDQLLLPENDAEESRILQDNNLAIIKHSPEFLINKDPDTPTNRVSTSLFSKERFAFILQYAIAYVSENNGQLQKHIMRYPQMFATKAIERTLDQGKRGGIIWHTQGSGKTALTYYSVKFLIDYFQKQNIIPKFYFIVDRIDLLTQAKKEFRSRGLTVHTVKSKEDFVRDIKSKAALHNERGNAEITVVNIHKFSEGAQIAAEQDYDINIQRIYFLDEAHRSYNPEGSFLANLEQSDKNAIKIGLTGTPLLGDEYNSKMLFGDYIHKYYYNASIADGYTLRLIREDIASNYRIELEKVLKEIEVKQGDIPRKDIFAHRTYAEPMLKYIVEDFETFRQANNDNTTGAMVVCDSSAQAEMLYEIFNEQYAQKEYAELPLAAEESESYNDKKRKSFKVKTARLILCDVGSKEERKVEVDDFKEGAIDLLFVYNMLLTGFDAKRLKKLYLGRLIHKHNLLQTLTRVNRTYHDYKFGYVVDFADISDEFKRTNQDYFRELQNENGNELESYNKLFLSKEELEEEINEIKEALFHYDTSVPENFSKQVSQIKDAKQMREIVKALSNAKSLYNLIRLYEHTELLEKIDFRKLAVLYTDANARLQLLNQKDALNNHLETTNLLNLALEDIVFEFNKVGEEELILADQLKDSLRKTREEFTNNFDKKDPKFTSLYQELERLFKNKKLEEVSQEQMTANIGALKEIHRKILELNRQNKLLQDKYNHDPKYCRIHKRLVEKGGISQRESQLFEALNAVKTDADQKVLNNTSIVQNEGYFDRMMIKLVINQFEEKNHIALNTESSKFISDLVVKEYTNEYHGH